jgi:RNA polymerase sigma factor (sigma-70 family)
MTGSNKDYADIHREMIEGCRKGDRRAQTEVYRLYYKAMYNTSLRIVGNTAEAEDVMQEAFFKAFRNIQSYRGEVSFGAWLKRIVINQSIDALRSRIKTESSIDQMPDTPDEMIDWEGNVAETELQVKRIREAIMRLPEGYRVVLSLHLLEGYDHEEIASILGIAGSTSRSQYIRAKQKLLEALKSK